MKYLAIIISIDNKLGLEPRPRLFCISALSENFSLLGAGRKVFTAAFNSEIFLHENRFHFPEKNNSIVLPYKMAAVGTLYRAFSLIPKGIK
jgi:hypothetical protein